MTDSFVTTLAQLLSVEDVTNIVITDAVADGEGQYVRSIRIFGEPNGDGGPAIVELKCRSSVKANINITTPTLDF